MGCNPKPNPSLQHPWTSMTITLDDHEVISINNQNDSSLVKWYNNGGFFTGWHKLKMDSLKVFFNNDERDTIFKLTKHLISEPVNKNYGSCTDYLGDIKLIIDYGNYKGPGSYRQSAEYSGVCEWESLSKETEILSSLLKRRIIWKK